VDDVFSIEVDLATHRLRLICDLDVMNSGDLRSSCS
jgi:hypothetical protein